jgi:hypothetical protein
VVVLDGVLTKCPDISGPGHRFLLFEYLFIYLDLFSGRSLVTAKLNLKFVSANQVSEFESR